MKEIKAIIQPFMLERVMNALHEIKDLPAVTVSTAHGISVERGTHDQVMKTKLEIMVPDERVEHLIEVIQKAARTGKAGDGRIFVRAANRSATMSHTSKVLSPVKAERLRRKAEHERRLKRKSRWITIGVVSALCLILQRKEMRAE